MDKPVDPTLAEELLTACRSEELIDAMKLASMLSISPRTLYRLKERGYLPEPIRLGGSVRWRQSDVQRWIAEGCPKQ